MSDEQFGRSASLIVAAGTDGIDLSAMHFRFQIKQSDEESPNTAVIRIYNLSDATVKKITGKTPVEFTRVILQAGYEGATGVIFDGTIKQFRPGKENATDKYLDILAAEGDVEYNFGICNTTLAAGSSPIDRIKVAAASMNIPLGQIPAGDYLAKTGGTLPRGKVLWGMGRAQMRCTAASIGSTWSMQDGKINVTPLTGYLPGEAVKLTSKTGLVGIPEQTEQGIKARCLLNPKLQIGGLVQIDNASINQTTQADLRADGVFQTASLPVGQAPYDKRAGLQFFADISNDGFYRLYVVEYVGDTRGQDWYADIICLAVDKSTETVQAYG